MTDLQTQQTLINNILKKYEDKINIHFFDDNIYFYDEEHENILPVIHFIDLHTKLFDENILQIQTGYYEILLDDNNLSDSPYLAIQNIDKLSKEKSKLFFKYLEESLKSFY